MMMIALRRLWLFHRADDGAITVDWVVLTAAIVSFGFLVGHAIWGETGGAADEIASFIGSQKMDTEF